MKRKIFNKWRAGDASIQWGRIWDMLERENYKILVLAGNHNQFKDWCAEHRVSPHNPSVRYVSGGHVLRGYHDAKNVKLIKYGTWYMRGDIQEELHIFELFNPDAK